MSFLRQLFIKHEEIPKLPTSLVILFTLILFVVDKMICFLYKTRGHTSNHCKNKDYKPEKTTI